MATSWNYRNFAKATISGSHNTVVTTLNLVAGHGTRLGSAWPAMAVVWQSSAFPDPADAFHDSPSKTELVKITNRTTDALTVVRAQEGTVGLDMTDVSKTFTIMLVHTAVQIGSEANLFENVKSHGAVGDGVADDTTAVIAAIDAAVDGGTVFFPSGSYALTTWPTAGKVVTKKLHVLGTVFSTLTGAVTADFLDIRDNFTMEYMSFSGWKSVVLLDNNPGTIDRVAVRNCYSTGHKHFFRWFPLAASQVIDSIQIEGCKLVNGTDRNLYVCASGVNPGTFENCIISNNVIDGGTRAIHVGENTTDKILPLQFKRVIIQGNSISGQASASTDVLTVSNWSSV